jgi:hypothetical protein
VVGSIATVVAGALFAAWPLQFRFSIARVRERVAQRGGDARRVEAAMDRRWIRVALWVAPVVGALLIVEGLVSLAL